MDVLEFETENLLYVPICSFPFLSLSLSLSLSRDTGFFVDPNILVISTDLYVRAITKKICNRKIDELLISRKPVRRHLGRLIRQFLFLFFFSFSFFFYFTLNRSVSLVRMMPVGYINHRFKM